MDKEEMFYTIWFSFFIVIFIVCAFWRVSMENKYDEILREKVYQLQVVTPDGKVYPVGDYSYYWEVRSE